jgi:hypothetical protein
VPSNEINNVGYTNIANDDTSYLTRETSLDGNTPILRTMFALGINRERVKDLNFLFIGLSSYEVGPVVCSTGSIGSAWDLNAYIWNFTTGVYDYFVGTNGGGATLGAGGQTLYGLVTRDVRNATVANYISTDGNVIIITMGHTVSNGDQSCFTADQAKLIVSYIPETTNYCQSSTLAPITVTNVGNVDINVDGNFSSAFSGVDKNLVLKVWRGNDSGCGTDGNGMGGWQRKCSVTSVLPEADWTADETSGTTLHDLSGNGHVGTLKGTNVSFTGNNCHARNCLWFSGSDTNVEIGDASSYLNNNFTISAWLKPGIGGTQYIVSTYMGFAGQRVSLEWDSGGTNIVCRAGTGSVSFNSDITDSTHHIACTRNTGGDVNVYLDGTLSQNGTDTAGTLDLTGSGNNFLHLGKNMGNASGYLDEIQIYTSTLTGGQIAQLYNFGRAPPADANTNAPTTTTCRQYDYTNSTVGARLATRLPTADTNQFCFSGEFDTFVNAGDHNKVFQTGSDFS